MIRMEKNFSWLDTQRKLVIFMPNFNGKRLTEHSIEKISTVVPHDQWLVIIGNDNVEDDFDHLRDRNVVSLTLHHDGPCPRNGAFIRNYVLKRCLSTHFLQKDGEVCLEGDFIKAVMKGVGWRAGKIAVLSPEQSQQYVDGANLDCLGAKIHQIEPVQPISDLGQIQRYLVSLDGKVNFLSYFHYAYCTRTKLLQALRGYDERYTHYGWEDVSMALRLAKSREYLHPDPNVYAIHLHHPSTVDRGELGNMGRIFAEDDFMGTNVRNPEKWGEGEQIK